MKRILTFSQFLTEASLNLTDPAKAGAELSSILGQTRDVYEIPKGSNTNAGPDVEKYLASVGLGRGAAWCHAYVYWVINELAKKLNIPNPAIKTGLCKEAWEKAPAENKLTIEQVRANPDLLRPGMVFIMWRKVNWKSGGFEGHTGIVLKTNPSDRTFTSIEGNTDEKATGEGNKVGVNTRRLDDQHLVGFIDWFAGKRTAEFEKAIAGEEVKPVLQNDQGGTITGSFLVPTTKPPSDKTVGDEEARAKDLQIDKSIVGAFLGSYKKSPGEEITKGDIRKFLFGKTYSEEATANKPAD